MYRNQSAVLCNTMKEEKDDFNAKIDRDNGRFLSTFSLLMMMQEAFVDSVDQVQTAQKVQSDI